MTTLDRSESPAIVGVYRRANARMVEALLAPALAAGWTTAWWALDAVDDALARFTVGSGSGEKLPLLNAVIERAVMGSRALVLADDDLVFERGDVVRLVDLSSRAGFGISQPAHARGSNVSHSITGAQRFSVARTTTFVESGPLVVVAPEWYELVVPLPAWRGMGWGVELEWMGLRDAGCRLGIVDACRIVHLGKVGLEYERRLLLRELRSELAERGIERFADIQWNLAVWRPWRRIPPWSANRRIQ